MNKHRLDARRNEIFAGLFMLWLISWIAVPAVISALGGGLAVMVIGQSVAVCIPVIVLVIRRGGSEHPTRAAVGGTLGFAFAFLFGAVGVAAFVGYGITGDNNLGPWAVALLWMAVISFAIGIASVRSKRAFVQQRSGPATGRTGKTRRPIERKS